MTKHPVASEPATSDPFAAVIREAGDAARARSTRYRSQISESLDRATTDAFALAAKLAQRPALRAALAARAERDDTQ